jgi:hypothetical protein
LEDILANMHFLERLMGKAYLVFVPFSQRGDDEEDCRCQYLQSQYTQHDFPYQA